MEPELYVLSDIPGIGELGEDTLIEWRQCSDCGKREEVIENISHSFQKWNGEDFIKALGTYYFVSERLKLLLEAEKIEGLTFRKCGIEMKEYYRRGKKAYSKDLPEFYLLTINNFLDGPEIWWTRREICPTCGRTGWNITLEGIKSTVSSTPEEEYIPREVYRSSYHGEDIFNLQDPGLPVITERFLKLISSFGHKYNMKRAKWSDNCSF